MKHSRSKPRTKVSEAIIALCYTLAACGIYTMSGFSKEKVMLMESYMGEKHGFLYSIYGNILLPVITIAAGYTAVYLTFCFIRQITEKGGK